MSGVDFPASNDERLARISDFHCKHVDASGGTWGECAACGYAWPCPTYQWATPALGDVDLNCTWDLDDCQFEDHDHAASVSGPS